MTGPAFTLAHDAWRQDRPDGTILLRSNRTMSAPALRSGDWLHEWAAATPQAIFLAERSGDGWREVTYAQALATVRALAGGLLARGLDGTRSIMILSGNSVDHGLLAVAAQYVGIPTVPVAEQYALLAGAGEQLAHVIALTRPAMVYAEDGDRFAQALGRDDLADLPRVVGRNPGPGMVLLADLMLAGPEAETQVDAAAARVGPDTVAKILLTSGSTSMPKGVATTQRMMCANQAQLADVLPFLRHHPPRIVDWLPWNHVFGGSHNFNLVLANGGALYIDEGKPTPPLVEKSLENLRLMQGTIAFNVPVGFAQVAAAMRADLALRRSYFENLDMVFYAGASLPSDLWAELEDMAREVRGEVPLFTSSWGMTETAPACLIQHQPGKGAGIIGVPMTGVTVKLVPVDDGRFDLRVKGPNVMQGYLNDPARTAEAFDDEGFFISGDAVSFVDPDQVNQGLRFEGRLAEEFKLATGTWVRAAGLRLEILQRLAPLAQDVIVTGAERMQVGLLIVPSGAARAGFDHAEQGGALVGQALKADIAEKLRGQTATGSSGRVRRALVLAEPPSVADGEATAKGNINFRTLLRRRAALVERLYDDADPAVILI